MRRPRAAPRARRSATRRPCVEARAQERQSRFRSSWDARETGNDKDFLHNLGSADYNTNVDVGQSAALGLDHHITGNFLGTKSDIADGSLRKYEFRTFNNIVGDYYVSPRFLEKVAMHFAKNYMAAMGCFDSKVKVPLVLGVWGPKGMGKTFQCELAFKQMGIEAVVMSAGELEHEWAGTPGRLIRERYRKAGDMSKVRGTMTCLMINDIDAGLGHFGHTQVTVNNQIVIGTLMNICDDPTRVSIGQDWIEQDVVRRTPIVVTGNDFSKMFAPLIRDGRMEKFYWEPTDDDVTAILFQMYKDDGMVYEDMQRLRMRFPGQPLDFFGAIRASTYDGQIREWIKRDVGIEIDPNKESLTEMSKRLVQGIDLPQFEPVRMTLDMLFAEGERLIAEQELVASTHLASEYLKSTGSGGPGLGISLG